MQPSPFSQESRASRPSLLRFISNYKLHATLRMMISDRAPGTKLYRGPPRLDILQLRGSICQPIKRNCWRWNLRRMRRNSAADAAKPEDPRHSSDAHARAAYIAGCRSETGRDHPRHIVPNPRRQRTRQTTLERLHPNVACNIGESVTARAAHVFSPDQGHRARLRHAPFARYARTPRLRRTIATGVYQSTPGAAMTLALASVALIR